MPLKNIKDQLHSGILLGSQYPARPVDPIKVKEIEQLIGVKIPDWYFSFLDEYGVVICDIIDHFDLYNFDIDSMHGFVQDYCLNFLEYYSGMLPIGNDLGNRAFYYSEQNNRPGIYISDVYPDPDQIYFVAPDLQTLLFDGGINGDIIEFNAQE